MHANKRIAPLFLAVTALTCVSAKADFVTNPQPTSAYQKGTTLLDFINGDFTFTSSLSGGGETLSYDTPLEELTVPVSWATWGSPPATQSSTPRVGYTNGLSTLTITLSKPASAFGLEIEPNATAIEETVADFYSGPKLAGVIDLFPNGDSGALLFAASTSTDPFTSVVITNLASDDFGIAQQRFKLLPVTTSPEPSTFLLMGSALFSAAVFMGRGRTRRTRLDERTASVR